MTSARALDAAQARRMQEAFGHLGAGRLAQALDIARRLAEEAPEAADSQQLLAMCLAETGDATGADAAFERALALAPRNEIVAANVASWWRKRGRLHDAMALLAALPATARTQTQLGMLALQARDLPRARSAFSAATRLAPAAPTAWHGLGNALRELQDPEAAAEAFRVLCRLSPQNPAAWLSLGVASRLAGRLDEAMECLQRAESLGGNSPELADALAGVLNDAARPGDALARARRLVADHPDYVPGHTLLGMLLWENGSLLAPGEDPLAGIRTAAHRRPQHRELQQAFLQALQSAGKSEEALEWCMRLRRATPEDPVLAWFEATARDALGQCMEAGTLLQEVDRFLGGNAEFLNARARNAFRAGQADLAQACAERALQVDPRNQEAWSHLGTAWRIAADPREYWLFDYERLIGCVEVEPPVLHSEQEGFLQGLSRSLERLHLASREPINQSLRNGSQTAGRLFGRDDAEIRGAETALRAAVERWLSGLPDDASHPFLSRKRSGVRIVGSWSVRLNSSGRHTNHIHHEGWLSSAFYVSLPPAVLDAGPDSRAGWIQFGQPMEDLGLDLPPRRVLKPRPGLLALFPSFMWHGTVPFHDANPRVTVAFDMQPTG